MINLNDVVPQKESIQKVEVVNGGTTENPIKAEVTNLPLAGDGQSIRVVVQSGSLAISNRPSSSTNSNVFLENILLLQSGGGFFAIPLCSYLTNVSSSALNSALASYKSAYATLVSGVTAATLHYSKVSNTGVITSETYNLKD